LGLGAIDYQSPIPLTSGPYHPGFPNHLLYSFPILLFRHMGSGHLRRFLFAARSVDNITRDEYRKIAATTLIVSDQIEKQECLYRNGNNITNQVTAKAYRQGRVNVPCISS
jgi:hypothetical protein